MKNARRRIEAPLKAKIALEALRGRTSVSELADEHGVHPNRIYAWKKQLETYAVYLFARRTREVAELEARVNSIVQNVKKDIN